MIYLSIIILSFNTEEILKSCLASIYKNLSDEFSYEVIVVDNASSDGSVKMVKEDFPKVKLITNKDNLGFTKGNNIGIKEAQGKYLILLNSDTEVLKGSLEKMIHFLEENQNVGALGPKLLNKDGSSQPSTGNFPDPIIVLNMLFKEHFGGSESVRVSPKIQKKVNWVMGAALMFRKEILAKAGYLDENMFMYMEEVEWCYRIVKAGFEIWFLPTAEIIHLGQASSRSGRKEPILRIYKGLRYYYKKHKNIFEQFFLEILLGLKAFSAYLLGLATNNEYLKTTYGEALRKN